MSSVYFWSCFCNSVVPKFIVFCFIWYRFTDPCHYSGLVVVVSVNSTLSNRIIFSLFIAQFLSTFCNYWHFILFSFKVLSNSSSSSLLTFQVAHLNRSTFLISESSFGIVQLLLVALLFFLWSSVGMHMLKLDRCRLQGFFKINILVL